MNLLRLRSTFDLSGNYISGVLLAIVRHCFVHRVGPFERIRVGNVTRLFDHHGSGKYCIV